MPKEGDRLANVTTDRLWQVLGVNDPPPMRVRGEVLLTASVADLRPHLPTFIGRRGVASAFYFPLAGNRATMILTARSPGGIIVDRVRFNPTTSNHRIRIGDGYVFSGGTLDLQERPVGLGGPLESFGFTGNSTNQLPQNGLFVQGQPQVVELGWFVPTGQELQIQNDSVNTTTSFNVEWTELLAAPQELIP